MSKRKKSKGKAKPQHTGTLPHGLDPTRPNPRNGMATHGLSLDDAIAAGRYMASKWLRWFTGALYALAVRQADVGTMAVTKDGIMLVDPCVKTWPIEWIAFGMLHEIGHWLRDHWDRGKAIGAEPGVWNLAGDLALNSEYHEARITVPEWALLPDRPEITAGCIFGPFLPIVLHFNPWVIDDLTLEHGETQEAYYAKLRDVIERVQLPAGAGGSSGKDDTEGDADGSSGGDGDEDDAEGQGDDDGPSGAGWTPGQGNGPQVVGRGHCGSCAGNPVDGEPGDDDPYRRSRAERENLKRQAAEEIRREGQAGRGNIPGGWSRWANDTLQTPVVPWGQKVARISRGAVTNVAGIGARTYARPSRRQAIYGWGDGTPIFSASVKTIPVVEVDVDTSGSMGQSELVDCASELAGILRTLNAPINFVAIDAEIHEAKPVASWREAVAMFTGGGGTDFRPAFERLRKMPKRKRPHLLIFMTDGGGPAPSVPVPGVQVIWLLVGAHAQKPWTCDDADGWNSTGSVAFGEFVFVDPDVEQRVLRQEMEAIDDADAA